MNLTIIHMCFKICLLGTSLAVQWLRLHAPHAKDISSIPGQGTKIMLYGAAKNKTKLKKIKITTSKIWFFFSLHYNCEIHPCCI